jgi:hypothetical protein
MVKVNEDFESEAACSALVISIRVLATSHFCNVGVIIMDLLGRVLYPLRYSLQLTGNGKPFH